MAISRKHYTARHTAHPEHITLIRVEGRSPEDAAGIAIESLDAIDGLIEIFAGNLDTIPADQRPLHIEDHRPATSGSSVVDDRLPA